MAKYWVKFFKNLCSIPFHEGFPRFPSFFRPLVMIHFDYFYMFFLFQWMSVEKLCMNKLIVGAFVVLSSSFHAFGQNGNEWIDFNQQYYKIPVAKNAVYRLTASDLQSVGIPVSTDPNHLQLFHRGVEQAIFVSGQEDGQLDAGDYLEFYGQKNDGTLDSRLYQPSEAQPHSYYNLFSDTTSYFLTIGAAPGKRMSEFSESNVNGIPAETYHYDERLLLNLEQYSAGLDINEVQNTQFDYGEGWTGNQIQQGQGIDYQITGITQTVTTGGVPEIELVVVGRGPMEHLAQLYVGSGQRLVGSITFSGYLSNRQSFAVEWIDITSDGKLPVTVRCVGVDGQPDRVSVSYIKVRYPQSVDAQSATEKTFILRQAPGKSYLSIKNPGSGLQLLDITDRDAPVRIGSTVTSTVNAMVETTDTRTIFAWSTFIKPSIKSVSFRQITPAQHDYIIISHPLLRQPSQGYSDPVAAYAEYRASASGGSFDTLVVNMQQLYDQFSYGEQSPLSIYNFLRYLASGNVPKYLLLIGKGLDVYYNYYRNPSGFTTYKDLVPPSGYPGSDIAYSAGLAGTLHEPAVPTGRIPANKSEEVANYLNKVKEMEALPYNELWRKDLLHLSGGIYEGEPQLFKSYMEDFQVVAEDHYLGGKVSALAKHSKEIQLLNIADQVNRGLNLITFFGHASPTLLDFELGYVTDPVQGYNNKGKYPAMLMNGCQVGAFFYTYTLFGEDWLMAKDRGAIGFIAHSGFGFTGSLKKYTETFYHVGYGDSTYITKGLGDIQKETARRYMETSDESMSNITQVQQMVLLGDPAVALFGARKADIEINDSHVTFHSFNNEPITAQTDSFAISMIVRNFGLAKADTIRIEVLRTLNDNSTITYDSLFPVTKYSDTLNFIIRNTQRNFGNNIFRITLDPDDVLSEYSKENNVASKTLFISLNGTKNLYPSAFAIVQNKEVSLALQATDLLSDERNFTIEIDTASTFDSPYKQVYTVKGKVLARQALSLLDADTLAYYWRTKLAEPRSGESDDWTQSSFTYIKNGGEGWAQVHFPQYMQNSSVGIIQDPELRRLRFKESSTPVSVATFGNAYPDYYKNVSVKIFNVEYMYSFPGFECRQNSINVVSFDRKSAIPYLGVKLEWFNRAGRTCGREPFVLNNYTYGDMIGTDGADLLHYVDNIQTGDSVLIFSIGNGYFSLWPEAAKIKLGEFGISVAQINSLEDNEPVIIFGRKGDAPGTAVIERTSVTPKSQQGVSISRNITGGYSSGDMSSGWIGPALKWDSLKVNVSEIGVTDQVTFNVVGIKISGSEEILFEDLSSGKDLSSIDAGEYPYLRIAFDIADETYLTPAQLNHWMVTYTPGPEGVLFYDGIQEMEEINEGLDWEGDYHFVNISDKNFPDSLAVRYQIFNQPQLISETRSMNIASPLPGDSTSFTVRLNTLAKSGLNDIDVYVNPRLVPEHYYDNNLLQLNGHLQVLTDALNPVMDVSVDGRHIVNEDYVSPDPSIRIKIWDENETILKSDTSGVRIFLTYPCADCQPTPILLTDPRIQWYAATDTSAFKVDFQLQGLEDGMYALRVEGADARGNQSGIDPYEIRFQVKNESSVSVTDPHPNPFSSEVFFGLVITGDVLPDQFELQLMNVNGQLQDRFTLEDFPVMHIGTNELIWDGTTANGNILPNGIYIYRLDLTIGDQVHRKIGKLVLVR